MESTVEQALRQAALAHKEGRIEAAERALCDILESQPTNAAANHLLGIIALSSNDTERALTLFKAALSANPNIEQYWLSYIASLLTHNRTELAREILKQARQEGFDSKELTALETQLNSSTSGEPVNALTPPRHQLTELIKLYQNQEYKAAKAPAYSMTSQYPKFPLGWTLLGAVLGYTGDRSAALEAHHKASELLPQDADLKNNLGQAFFELDRLEEAEDNFKNALTLKPNFGKAHSNLGNTLHKQGRLQEAVISFKKAISLEPDSAVAHNNLGRTLFTLGELAEAEESCKKATELNADLTEAYFNMGNILSELRRFEEAIASYNVAISLKPHYDDAHNNLGTVLKELGRLNEAEACFRKAIALNNASARSYSNLGITLRELGKLEESQISYAKAIELDPNFIEAYSNLAITQKEMGQHDTAVSNNQSAFALRTGIQPGAEDRLAPAITGLLIEITNKCNFHCTFCPSDLQKRDIGFMDFDLIKELYKEASEKKITNEVSLHLMGEPTLHPKIIEILKFGALQNIKTELTTNISTLVPKNVTKILDSLYGTIIASHMSPTEDTYHFRGEVGISWERYLGNLRTLVREYLTRVAQGASLRSQLTIRVMTTQNTASNVIVTDTPHEARLIFKEWSDYVAKIERELGMEPFQRISYDSQDLLQENRNSSVSYLLQKGIKLQFWRAFTFANTRVGDEYKLEAQDEGTYCPKPFEDIGILWNGDVTLCGLDHDGELKVGNVKNSSIEEIIQSKEAGHLRASMLGQRPLPSICKVCQSKPVKR